MNAGVVSLGVTFLFFLVTALSTGNRMYLLIALLIACAFALAYLSVFLAARTARVRCELSAQKVNRGETVCLNVSVAYRGVLPLAPVTLRMRETPNTPAATLVIDGGGRRRQRVAHAFRAAHVGTSLPGVESYCLSDVFGFFRVRGQVGDNAGELMVTPIPFPVEPLTFASGDMGLETMKRAMEDPASPNDFRSYQPGDPLKKVHWKLSLRKRELFVRRYEEPALMEALVLLDCSPPHVSPSASPQTVSCLKDALLETAASVALCQMKAENALRMPLLGETNLEFDGAMGVPSLLEELARLNFSSAERFERVLQLEMRRMKTTGATAIITTRLSSVLVDIILRLKRAGPNVRLYLVTYSKDDPQIGKWVARLQIAGIEVCYVTPETPAPQTP